MIMDVSTGDSQLEETRMPHPTVRRASRSAAVLATAAAAALGPGLPAQAAPTERPTVLPLRLTGDQVPRGDADGRGFAVLTLDPGHETICYLVSWRKVAGFVTAMHLHAGRRGATGPHHVELLNDVKIPGNDAMIRDCVHVEGGHESTLSGADRIREIIADPRGFYLNLHSIAKPDGAIRGQLR
jgi:hypothetical protein